MKLYFNECRRTAVSLVYFLFIAALILGWHEKFQGITKAEIARAEGKSSADISFDFDRPLLAEPSTEDEYFGSKISEDNPEAIITGVTRTLLREYQNNIYAAYPLGNYKAVTLDSHEQARVLEILCEITGLKEQQLENLPKDYFPAVTGTIFSADRMGMDNVGSEAVQEGNKSDHGSGEIDKTQRFVAQVNYEHFNELMREMETIIGEKGSYYSKEMMITYFGLSEMTYEEAYAEYTQTIEEDKVTGGFARLFCDYIGLSLGLYPIFVTVVLWLKDRFNTVTELLYVRRVSSLKLVLARYCAGITMIFIPVLLLSFESLLPLLSFGNKYGIFIDCLAYIKYILWWLLPEIMIVTAIGMFFTLLTDSPIAVFGQFLWWIIDKGITGLSGDTGITTLMIRHNTLREYKAIQNGFEIICINRLLMMTISILLIILSVWILQQKRKGRIDVANIYGRFFKNLKNKFSFSYTK